MLRSPRWRNPGPVRSSPRRATQRRDLARAAREQGPRIHEAERIPGRVEGVERPLPPRPHSYLAHRALRVAVEPLGREAAKSGRPSVECLDSVGREVNRFRRHRTAPSVVRWASEYAQDDVARIEVDPTRGHEPPSAPEEPFVEPASSGKVVGRDQDAKDPRAPTTSHAPRTGRGQLTGRAGPHAAGAESIWSSCFPTFSPAKRRVRPRGAWRSPTRRSSLGVSRPERNRGSSASTASGSRGR